MDCNLAYGSLITLGRLLDQRQVSPVDIVRAFLGRIRQYNGRLASYITVCGDAALRRRGPRSRRSRARGTAAAGSTACRSRTRTSA